MRGFIIDLGYATIYTDITDVERALKTEDGIGFVDGWEQRRN
jgi:hypothetical protein